MMRPEDTFIIRGEFRTEHTPARSNSSFASGRYPARINGFFEDGLVRLGGEPGSDPCLASFLGIVIWECCRGAADAVSLLPWILFVVEIELSVTGRNDRGDYQGDIRCENPALWAPGDAHLEPAFVETNDLQRGPLPKGSNRRVAGRWSPKEVGALITDTPAHMTDRGGGPSGRVDFPDPRLRNSAYSAASSEANILEERSVSAKGANPTPAMEDDTRRVDADRGPDGAALRDLVECRAQASSPWLQTTARLLRPHPWWRDAAPSEAAPSSKTSGAPC